MPYGHDHIQVYFVEYRELQTAAMLAEPIHEIRSALPEIDLSLCGGRSKSKIERVDLRQAHVHLQSSYHTLGSCWSRGSD